MNYAFPVAPYLIKYSRWTIKKSGRNVHYIIGRSRKVINSFPDPGLCIYCGRLGTKRGREHVIPFALSGNVVIQEASCDNCADNTKKVEEYCSRGFLLAARTHLGLQSRSKSLPKTLPLVSVLNGHEVVLDLPISQHPFLFVALLLRPCTFFNSEDVQKESSMSSVSIPVYPDYTSRVDALGVGRFATDSAIDYYAFFALLAKIAHCCAVGILGLDKFTPLLIETIFDKSDEPWTYVGGCDEDYRRETSDWNTLHQYRIHHQEIRGKIYVICDVQLFSNLGAPKYRVIVGESRTDLKNSGKKG